MMSIGESIRNLRKKAGFTQKQLAEKVGVNEVTIRSYEAEKYNPKMNTLTKLCVALDCKITDLIDEDSKKYYRMFDYTEGYEQQQREEAARKTPKAFTMENGKKVAVDKPVKFTTPSRSHAQTEAYDLFNSLLSEDWVMSQEQETTAVQLREMLGAYNRLNDSGRKEAVKMVDELTEIPRYIQPDKPANYVKAAHAIPGASEEDKEHDEDIMNNF